MTNTDKSPETVIAAKDATHIIYKRHTGPRSYERKEGKFIITRNHRIRIAEKPEDIVTGDKPVIPAHLAADLVEAGVAEYFAAKPADTKPAETKAPEGKEPAVVSAKEPAKEG